MVEEYTHGLPDLNSAHPIIPPAVQIQQIHKENEDQKTYNRSKKDVFLVAIEIKMRNMRTVPTTFYNQNCPSHDCGRKKIQQNEGSSLVNCAQLVYVRNHLFFVLFSCISEYQLLKRFVLRLLEGICDVSELEVGYVVIQLCNAENYEKYHKCVNFIVIEAFGHSCKENEVDEVSDLHCSNHVLGVLVVLHKTQL